MHLFVSIARRDPHLLVEASANVARAWKRNEKGFGFFAKGSLPYLEDRGLEFTMNVRVRPKGRFSHFASFPENLQTHGFWGAKGETGAYDVENGKVVLLFDVDALKDVLERKGGETLNLAPVTLVHGPLGLYIQMNVSVRIVPTPPTPIGDIREWDTQFCQGGLPSLGKRRP
jgi:hypothetical protein